MNPNLSWDDLPKLSCWVLLLSPLSLCVLYMWFSLFFTLGLILSMNTNLSWDDLPKLSCWALLLSPLSLCLLHMWFHNGPKRMTQIPHSSSPPQLLDPSRTCNLRSSSPNLVLDPQDWKNHEYIYYPSLGHSRTIGSKWTWVVGIITYLGEGRGGERRGEERRPPT